MVVLPVGNVLLCTSEGDGPGTELEASIWGVGLQGHTWETLGLLL